MFPENLSSLAAWPCEFQEEIRRHSSKRNFSLTPSNNFELGINILLGCKENYITQGHKHCYRLRSGGGGRKLEAIETNFNKWERHGFGKDNVNILIPHMGC